ncbi:MAG: YaaA family protein [Firmicutes bacterium]|nr:YaaA family protein [Bacillota bacterium]
MIILLSPAKTFAKTITPFESSPIFQSDALSMIAKLSKMSASNLSQKMHISKDLSLKVKSDYMTFNQIISSAIYFYDGYAFKGFAIHSLNEKNLLYLQDHLYMLSGLYGLVRPFDGISAYRLEIKDQIIKNLYAFWKPKLMEYLSSTHPNELFINLASQEYSKVLHHFLPVLTISFYERSNDQLKAISMHVKMMRGKMANYLIINEINDKEQIKQIAIDDYHYDPHQSSKFEYIFIKEIHQ